LLNQDILFDIGARPFDWKSLLSSFGLFLLGLSLVVMRGKKIGVFLIKNIGYIMGCVSVLVMAYMLTSWFSKKREGSEALQKGNFSLVEGKVNNFKPMPYEGHAEESFTLERNVSRTPTMSTHLALIIVLLTADPFVRTCTSAFHTLTGVF